MGDTSHEIKRLQSGTYSVSVGRLGRKLLGWMIIREDDKNPSEILFHSGFLPALGCSRSGLDQEDTSSQRRCRGFAINFAR